MNNPYYQDEWVTIYHGDCREILPELPKVDLVVTDPDYNAKNIGPNEREYEAGMPALEMDDYEAWCGNWFRLVA